MGKQKHIHLEKEDRKELEQLIKSGTNFARVIARARTLLLLDRSQGQKRTINEVREGAMVSQGTIYNLKQRYFAGGLPEALYEKPRPGRPVTKMTGDVEAHLVALACSDAPEGYERWTLRIEDQITYGTDEVSGIAV
jgi:transposase